MTPRTLPPLTALRALAAVHEAGSVTAAARHLNVSHSAISHQLKILEQWSPVPLFVRRGRNTLLTEAAASLAVVIQEAFGSIRQEMERLPMRGTKSISLSVMPAVAIHWVVPRLERFAQHFPALRLHLSFGHADRSNTPFPDVAIQFAPRDKLMASDQEFLPGAASPMCAPSLIDRFEGDTERALQEALLLQDEDLRMWRLWFARSMIDRASIVEESSLLMDNSSLLHSAALVGVGIALCRSSLVARDVGEGKLVALSSVSIDEDRCYFIRVDPEKKADPAVRDVVAWLHAESREGFC